jgi:2-oxoisovalerate dehydrogenase E1 component alpha subunit
MNRNAGVMDQIMMDAKRQGRTSFYMVSAGEEAIGVGSVAALSPEDPLFLQYREQGLLSKEESRYAN